MKHVMIRLNLTENVSRFISIVNRYPYQMDLWSGRHVRDAKSVLEIFSLDLSRPLSLEIHHDNCDHLLEELIPFMET